MYRLFFVKANFVTGAQIQLISKASGHSLHIVQDPSGELVVEGKGDIGPQAWNGTKNSIKIFHNHNTYHIFQSLNNLFFFSDMDCIQRRKQPSPSLQLQ